MKNLQIHIEVNPEMYVRNPDSSELGHAIISNSIELIYEIGFESFTFKKLGKKIGSPESSIYRYFENKHMLLVYLTNWYWSWVEYKLVFATANLKSSRQKLEEAITIITHPILIDHSFSHVNEVFLHEIIITESVKIYHTKDVDKENDKGCFSVYKRIVSRVSEIVLEINPVFEFPQMLISTVIEGVNQQRYFAKHFPSLTNSKDEKDSVSEFYTQLVFKMLEK